MNSIFFILIMKKTFCLFLIITCIFVLFSCTKQDYFSNESLNQNQNSETQIYNSSKLFPYLITVNNEIKYGYIDQEGKIIIPATFDSVSHFSEGLAEAQINDKCGYIDETGRFSIQLRCQHYTRKFSNDLALIKVDSKYGYIDKSGKMVIEPKFDDAESFHEELAAIRLKDKFGYIDKKGKIVITLPKNYEKIENFHKGIAAIKIKNKWGFIDKKGIVIISPKFDDVSDLEKGFSEDVAAVKINGKWGYINRKGESVIPFKFDYAYPFSEGLALIVNGFYDHNFIDQTGKIVISIPQKKYRAFPFSEGLAVIKSENKCGYIDTNGVIVIPAKFELKCGDFEGGIARVQQIVENFRWFGIKRDYFDGYINKKDEFVWSNKKTLE